MSTARLRPLGIFILAYASLAGGADAGIVVFSTPQNPKGGTDKFEVKVDGDDKTFPLNFPATQDASVDAKLFTDEVNRLFAPLGGGPASLNGATVTVAGDQTAKALSDPAKTVVTMGEMVPSTPPPGTGVLSFVGDPGGTTYGGTQSTFSASIQLTSPTFGNVTAQSSLSFSQLIAPTAAAILDQTFSQLDAALPAVLQPDLHLDMTTGQILFAFPAGSTFGAVDISSTDRMTDTSFGMTSVPEPSSLVLAGAAALSVLGAWAWRQSGAARRCRRRTGGAGGIVDRR
jgi:PEP-CTERM motif